MVVKDLILTQFTQLVMVPKGLARQQDKFQGLSSLREHNSR